MGCDIHSFAEVRLNGKWEKVGDHFKLDSFDQGIYKKEYGSQPFRDRNYSIFAFLADVRNYDHCTPISGARGFPKDSQYLNEFVPDGLWGECPRYSFFSESGCHSYSWLLLSELLEFDYDKTFWNRRIYRPNPGGKGGDGAALAEEGEGKIVSYRDNLGENYFRILDELKELGHPEDVRVVFWFDN